MICDFAQTRFLLNLFEHYVLIGSHISDFGSDSHIRLKMFCLPIQGSTWTQDIIYIESSWFSSLSLELQRPQYHGSTYDPGRFMHSSYMSYRWQHLTENLIDRRTFGQSSPSSEHSCKQRHIISIKLIFQWKMRFTIVNFIF